jgi:hypothetical protein
MNARVVAPLVSLLVAGVAAFSFVGTVAGAGPDDAGAAPDAGAPALVDAGSADAASFEAPPPPPLPPPTPPAPVVVETVAPPPRARNPIFVPRTDHFLGAGLDLGFSGPLPDLGVMVAYEPYRFLRVAGGLDHNLIGVGVKGDLTIINPYVVPVSLTAEFGHFFEADANSLVKKVKSKQKDVPSLKKVGYDYTNLLLGFEAGSRLVRFYIRGGTSFLRAQANDFQQSLMAANVTVSRASDPKISYQGPVFKLGLMFFFP